MQICKNLVAGIFTGVVLSSIGCGGPSTASVSGQVTYENEPVGKGYITFTPTDGKGASAGGAIEDGDYHIDELPPGPKMVTVVATRKVNFASSSEEMMQRAREARTRGDVDGLVDPADTIPDNAVGNNQQVDLPPGSSSLDFHLQKPGNR